jgi:hypothetical protein
MACGAILARDTPSAPACCHQRQLADRDGSPIDLRCRSRCTSFFTSRPSNRPACLLRKYECGDHPGPSNRQRGQLPEPRTAIKQTADATAEVKAETHRFSRRASGGRTQPPKMPTMRSRSPSRYRVSAASWSGRRFASAETWSGTKTGGPAVGGPVEFSIRRTAPAQETAGSRPSGNRRRYGCRGTPRSDARSQAHSAVVRAGGRRRAG